MEMGHVLARDIISDLPLNIIEHILVHLPIRDAVRTSILSRTWNYKWVTLPNLIFDDYCIPTSEHLVRIKKLVDFVHRVLLLHRGPIHRFDLSVSYLQDCSDINQWILFLSRSGVKEFILKLKWDDKIAWDDCFKVPSCLFSCQQLSYLELFCCVFKPHPTINGFGCLKSLILQDVFCANNVLESLIASCPLLEQLSLIYIDGLTSLEIHAPNLKCLHLESYIDDLCIENSPFLANLFLGYFISETIENFDQVACSLIKDLNCLPGLERLVVQHDFMKCVRLGGIPEKLSTSYNHLKDLKLCDVCFRDMYEISFTLCLISCSPTLQRLEISAKLCIQAATEAPDLDFWETQHTSNCSLNQLQSVNITDIFGMPHELQFIKFILAKSPALQTMGITCHSDVTEGGRLDMLTQLVQFRRVSTQAEIICYK